MARRNHQQQENMPDPNRYEGEGDGSNVDLMAMAEDGMVDVPDLMTDGADLPLMTWDNSAEVRGGDLTSLGFAKLVPGFRFRGFVLGIVAVDSNYDSPAGKKKQNVFILKGTARVPVQGGDGGAMAEVRGKIKIPCYAALEEAFNENAIQEKKSGKKIPIEVSYEGQGPDAKDEDGNKTRSGRHMFRVTRIAPALTS